jgi:hypothetical protein
MSDLGTSTTPGSEAISIESRLTSLLRARKEYLDKVDEIDKQLTNVVRDEVPSTNNISIQILKAGLAASPINFESTFLEYHRTGKPSLVIAQRNRVLLNYPGYSEVALVVPSTPSSSSVRTNPLPLAEPVDQSYRVETPTRNVIDLNELAPYASLLEAYLANDNA